MFAQLSGIAQAMLSRVNHTAGSTIPCPHTSDCFPHNAVQEASRAANGHVLMTDVEEKNLCMIFRWLTDLGISELDAKDYIRTHRINPIRDAYIHRDKTRNLLLAVLKAANREPTSRMKAILEEEVSVDDNGKVDLEAFTGGDLRKWVEFLKNAMENRAHLQWEKWRFFGP
ncbi:hypothetical protein VKT23_019693 [Stygiomarasmius scandens]|uniref:Uncharacterized protein n=1 Tax=Marasmiellus scandens TaxID=2682957 RepID=A0ABR1IN57_9AGAR